MFTGIVEEIGTITSVRPGGLSADGSPADTRLTIRAARVLDGSTRLGASIAVDGVCLTVAALHNDGFEVDVMPATLARTTIGTLEPGSRVNLERAVPAMGRLDGHIVQGHVDGTATLIARNPGPRWDALTFRLPASLLRYVVPQGSIAVAGVSLTITHLTDDGFGVALIPTTLAETTLGALASGDSVNVEVDILAKYVERLIAPKEAGEK